MYAVYFSVCMLHITHKKKTSRCKKGSVDYSELLEFLTMYPTAKFSVPAHAIELHCHQPCWLTPATLSAVTVRGGGIGQKWFLKKGGGVVDLGTARNSEIPSEVN